MSADSAAVQKRFIDKFGLEFPLIPDPKRAIIDAWGVRKVMGLVAQRSTFIVGPDGRVAKVWPAVKVEGHADEVLAALRELRSR